MLVQSSNCHIFSEGHKHCTRPIQVWIASKFTLLDCICYLTLIYYYLLFLYDLWTHKVESCTIVVQYSLQTVVYVVLLNAQF